MPFGGGGAKEGVFGIEVELSAFEVAEGAGATTGAGRLPVLGLKVLGRSFHPSVSCLVADFGGGAGGPLVVGKDGTGVPIGFPTDGL